MTLPKVLAAPMITAVRPVKSNNGLFVEMVLASKTAG